MQRMDEIVNSTFSQRREEDEARKDLDPVSIAIVNRLFVLFEAICRGFEKQYSGAQRKLNVEKTQWARAFMDSGITQIEQIEKGIKQCRLESPINTPTIGQFISWCKPTMKDFGLPPVEEAYEISILINRQFSDYKPECQKTYSVIKHVINQIGSSNYRSMNADRAFNVFERYYPIACEQFASGRLKEIPLAIDKKHVPHPQDKIRSNAARLTALKSIRQMGLPISISHE